MTPFTVRGVPRSLHKDAWWIAADATSGVGAHPPKPRETVPRATMVALLILIGLADYLLYHLIPGVALPIFLISVAVAAHVFCFRTVTIKQALTAWAILILALIPAIDLVQVISVLFALAGMLAFVGIMTGRTRQAMAWAAIRFPVIGVIGTILDAITIVNQPRPAQGVGLAASLRDWIVPGVLGLIFACLMIVANPVIDQWITDLFADKSIPMPQIGQVVFWMVLTPMIWPFLRLVRLQSSLLRTTPQMQTFGQVWFLSGRSVTRALILFNVIFAAQTATDLAILWGEVALPEGLTYAQYAYRGAYPLLFAALLAGGFALFAQPFLIGRPALRILLLLWVAQTALLVASSMLRLDLYIDAYGLTRMRFLAFIWMGVIGGGLILMLWQTVRGFGPGWLMLRAGELGLIATYAVALINVDGMIARHNLGNAALPLDEYHICHLGEGAAPAITQYNQTNARKICGYPFSYAPKVAEPSDWREWGYRNARLRTSLAQIKGATQ